VRLASWSACASSASFRALPGRISEHPGARSFCLKPRPSAFCFRPSPSRITITTAATRNVTPTGSPEYRVMPYCGVFSTLAESRPIMILKSQINFLWPREKTAMWACRAWVREFDCHFPNIRIENRGTKSAVACPPKTGCGIAPVVCIREHWPRLRSVSCSADQSRFGAGSRRALSGYVGPPGPNNRSNSPDTAPRLVS
jgi:hypothetical protein